MRIAAGGRPNVGVDPAQWFGQPSSQRSGVNLGERTQVLGSTVSHRPSRRTRCETVHRPIAGVSTDDQAVSDADPPAPRSRRTTDWVRCPTYGRTTSRAWAFSDGIARLVRLRDRVCRTPWCDAPVRHVDHVQAHQDGGPTSETNGQGLCESCNHAKHAAGWHSRIRPGRRHEMETTTPTGHTYRSRAPATWPAAPPLATTGSTSCSAPSSGSPPERRRCRRPRLASDPWQPCCPSCS